MKSTVFELDLVSFECLSSLHFFVTSCDAPPANLENLEQFRQQNGSKKYGFYHFQEIVAYSSID